jgi:hypothetical protein
VKLLSKGSIDSITSDGNMAMVNVISTPNRH